MIRIRQTPYTRTDGEPYAPFPDIVLTHLGVIAMAGGEDLPGDLGDIDDPDDADYTILVYDPGPQDLTTPPGRLRQMLKDLIDRVGGVKIFGMGPDFMWSDGTTFQNGSAGGAIGDWVFYDTHNCDGDGRWVRGTDGNEVCTTSIGILVHELGHVVLNHPSGDPFDPDVLDDDERAAVGVENDLRIAQGLVPRDPDHWWESSCGCPGGDDCCIVASVATNSPYSLEVHKMRRVREKMLRNTRFGQLLFDVLHSEYYSFSVPVCRIMVVDDASKNNVLEWLVRPLMRSFEIAWEFVKAPNDPTALGRLIEEDQATDLIPIEGVSWSGIQLILQMFDSGTPFPKDQFALDQGTVEILDHLSLHLPNTPNIKWGILESLMIYATAREKFEESKNVTTTGLWMADALTDWLGKTPLDYILENILEDDLALDLAQLAETVYTRDAIRHQIGTRIVGKQNLDPDTYLFQKLKKLNYLP